MQILELIELIVINQLDLWNLLDQWNLKFQILSQISRMLLTKLKEIYKVKNRSIILKVLKICKNNNKFILNILINILFY